MLILVCVTYFGVEFEMECATFRPASTGIEKQVETPHIPFQTPLKRKLSLLSFLILEAMNNILDINYCSCITRKPI